MKGLYWRIEESTYTEKASFLTWTEWHVHSRSSKDCYPDWSPPGKDCWPVKSDQESYTDGCCPVSVSLETPGDWMLGTQCSLSDCDGGKVLLVLQI